MKIIDVQTGEVKAGKEDTVLRSMAIGSCVVIAAYDAGKKIGALAHIMLPGKSPEGRNTQRNRYAADAIKEMMTLMIRMEADKNDIVVCLVGGANVLEKDDDTICKANINSVIDILDKKRIKIIAKALGGVERKSISLDIKKGVVYYSEGNTEEKLLWSLEETVYE